MGTGALPSMYSAFYERDIGQSRSVTAGAASAPLTERLLPGRYRITLSTPMVAPAVLWIKTGPWIAGTPVAATAAVGPHTLPWTSGMTEFEFNVVKDYNDGLAVIAPSGTPIVFVTKVSLK